MTTLPDLAHPLDEIVTDDDQRARFRIEDDAAAAWAMRKLRSVRARQQQNDRIAADEIARVREWLAQVDAPLERDATYFEAILTDYALRCRQDERDGRKTIALPTGKVTTRTTAAKINVDDDEFLPWARQNHPDLIRVKETPNTAAIKELIDGRPAPVTSDGELLPGVQVLPGGVSATVTPDLT